MTSLEHFSFGDCPAVSIISFNPEISAVIKPTVGRIVWYWVAKPSPQTQPLAAIVASVIDDSHVSLGVFDASGASHPEANVPLIQDGDAVPQLSHYCEWMPYQKGQAAKTEALEKAAR